MNMHKARKLSPAIKRAVEGRERVEREFTPIEVYFINSADHLAQIGRQAGTEPEDTLFFFQLATAAGLRNREIQEMAGWPHMVCPTCNAMYPPGFDSCGMHKDCRIPLRAATPEEEKRWGQFAGWKRDGYTGI
jgi:hypothetical protein